MNDVVFEGDGPAVPDRALLPAHVGPVTSPVATALVRARIVPNERAARFLAVLVAVLGVGGAFTSMYLSAPNRGVAGIAYEDLTPEQRAEIPAAERVYLELVAERRRTEAAVNGSM